MGTIQVQFTHKKKIKNTFLVKCVSAINRHIYCFTLTQKKKTKNSIIQFNIFTYTMTNDQWKYILYILIPTKAKLLHLSHSLSLFHYLYALFSEWTSIYTLSYFIIYTLHYTLHSYLSYYFENIKKNIHIFCFNSVFDFLSIIFPVTVQKFLKLIYENNTPFFRTPSSVLCFHINEVCTKVVLVPARNDSGQMKRLWTTVVPPPPHSLNM